VYTCDRALGLTSVHEALAQLWATTQDHSRTAYHYDLAQESFNYYQGAAAPAPTSEWRPQSSKRPSASRALRGPR
jgi:hypothetical protein